MLYEDETIVWRFALPRLGWWRRAQRYRLPTRPLSQGQIKQQESGKRQTWLQYRAWSRITSGVLLSVIGAVQYGTSKVFYKIVPHFEAQEFRQYIHQVMATFNKIDTLIGSRALTAYGDVDGPSAANNRPWSRKCTARLLRRSDANASAHGYGGTRSVRREGAGSVG